MIQFHRTLTLATIGAVLCLLSEQARSAEKEKAPAPALVKKRESAVALAEAGKAREAEVAIRAVVTEAEQSLGAEHRFTLRNRMGLARGR